MAMVSAACLYAYEESLLTFDTGQVLSANQDLGIKVATPVGTVFGQLAFGWLADVFGRKRMCRPQLNCSQETSVLKIYPLERRH